MEINAPQLIDNLEEVNQLISDFSRKKCFTNNYLLVNQLESLILSKNLYALIGNDNLILLVDKGISFKVYYHINNLEEPFIVNANKPLMMEIVFKGDQPATIKEFWCRNGFAEHLTRMNFSLTYQQKSVVENINSSLVIKIADNEFESKLTTNLFENDLDRYTGDLKSFKEIDTFVKNSNIFCAYFENEFCGALQFEWINSICWLGHIAIDGKYRGKGIANSLVATYIEHNKQTEDTRYQLWVIDNNLPAVNLYKKFGFKHTGKTTVSMLKL
jgi:ribosomal protein S18 acetylase RimI-like enzyme